MRRVAAAAAIAAALGAPAAARAGSYEVVVCHDPASGQSAPTDAISFPASGAYVDAGVYDGCGPAGYLYAALDGVAAHGPGDVAAWRFSAPAGTTITAAQAWRAFYASPASPYAAPIDTLETVGADGTLGVLAACAQTYGCTQTGATDLGSGSLLSYGGLDGVVAIQGAAGCGGGQTCAPGGSAVCPELGADPCLAANELYAMVVTLEDPTPPVASGVGGPLIGAGPLSGPAQITFGAT